MDFLEKDLEEIIYSSPQNQIKERGLNNFIYSAIERQYPIGNYGIADLITVRFMSGAPFLINVYELKNKVINVASFWQLIRYMRGVIDFMNKLGVASHKYRLKGTLIGREIDMNGDLCYIPDLLPSISMYTYSYSFTGILFEEQYGMKLKNSGMPSMPKGLYEEIKSPKDLLRSISFMQNCANGAIEIEKSP